MNKYRMLIVLCSLLIALVFAACELGDPVVPPSYTVVYHSNGGNGAMDSSTHVLSASKDLNANAFTREGYTFTGWAETPEGEVKYEDGQSVKGLSKEIGAVINLYAQWRGISYTVVYIPMDGLGTMEPSVFTYDVPQNLRANAFTFPVEGYAFLGWTREPHDPHEEGDLRPPDYTDGQSVSNLTAEDGATITLYAKWGFNTYWVRYHSNHENFSVETSPLTYGVQGNLMINFFTRTGYTFTGWNTREDGQGTGYADGASVLNLAAPGQTVVLYAQWQRHSYTVVYNKNAGDATGSMADTPFIYGAPQNLPPNTFTRAGYTFTGWARTAAGNVEFTDGMNVTNLTETDRATVTLFAQWALAYTVTFDADGGNPAPAQQMVVSGGRVSQPLTMTKANHAFDGWYRENTLTTLWNFTTDTVTGPLTLYAKWVPMYTVTFNADGGVPAPDTVTVRHGGTITRPASMSKTGYTFIGWYREAQLLNEYDFNAPVTGPTTLYAKWSLYYYIAYNPNGGTGTMAETTHGIDVPQALRANTFTRYGCTFLGWATSPGGAVAYTDGQSVTNLSTTAGALVTLYAVWREDIVRVPGATMGDKYDWLYLHAQSGGEYLVEFSDNETVNNYDLSWSVTNVTLSLRGIGAMRTLTLSSNGSMFTVGSGITLVLDENITLRGLSANTAPLVTVNTGGTLMMNAGTFITGNTNAGTISSNGGGVLVNGAFTMNGGTISTNRTTSNASLTGAVTSYGSGVYVTGTFTMNDGTISGNTASATNTNTGAYTANAGGGGVYVTGNAARFTMNGGTITGNTATATKASGANSYGGGVYVTGSAFTMSGGTVSSNTVTVSAGTNGFGGGVYADGAFTMSGTAKISSNRAPQGGGAYTVSAFGMSGGEISDNTATASGGGVYAGSVSMTGGVISGNAAASSGGGVYTAGTLTMSGTAKISGNSVSGTAVNGGGVHAGTVIMGGGEISGNTAASSGGGVQATTFTMNNGTISGNRATGGSGGGVNAGTFTLNNGTISGNTAGTYGGGVYISVTFSKTGGTVYGNVDGDANSNTVRTAAGVVTNGRGHAVYAAGTPAKGRERTAAPEITLSYDASAHPVTYSGPWDF